MKEYLKMSDVFETAVVRDDRNYITRGMNNVADFGHNSILSSYAAHAINSHDELVAGVERLRDAMSGLLSLTEHFAECGGWDVNAYAEYKKAKGA